MRETERRTEGMEGRIDDGRLVEIIVGAGDPPTDAEIAAIVRSAVAHCRKMENGWDQYKYGAISIRRGMQGMNWYEAFRALFRDMKNDPPLSPKDYGSYLVYRGDLAGGSFVGFARDNDILGLWVESADRDAEEDMNANPAGFTLVPIVGVVWDKAVRASEILEDEE